MIFKQIKTFYKNSVDLLEEMNIQSSHFLFKWDLEGNFYYSGDILLKSLGYTNTNLSTIIEHEFDIIHPNDLQETKEKMLSVQKGNIIKNLIFRCRQKNGSYLYLQSYLYPKFNNTGQIIAIYGVIRDINKKIKMDERYNEKRELYTQIFKNVNDAILIIENEVFIDCNNKTLELFHCTRAELLGKQFEMFVPEFQQDGIKSVEKIKRISQNATQNESQIFEIELLTFDKIRFSTNFSLTPLKDKNIIVAIIRDITEQKRMQSLLKSREKQLREILEHSLNAAYKYNCISRNYEYISPVIKNLIGISAEEILSFSYEEVNGFVHPDDLHKFRFDEEQIEENPSLEIHHNLEYRMRNKDGSYKWIGDTHTLYRDSNGNPKYIIGVIREISEQKMREQKLEEIIKEKEILLKEINHRVKNNLQIITSLFNLQLSYYKNPEFERIVKESKKRIESILIVHETLHQTDDLTKVEFKQFIEILIKNIFETYDIKSENITFDIEIKDINLNLNQSIPIALIINEIVSNSLKHAFPDDRKGNVFISLSKDENRNILNISDDGIGISTEISAKNKTFGIQLIKLLTKQLKANVKLDTSNGTKYEIIFKGP